MSAKIIELAGQRWAILPESEYRRLLDGGSPDSGGPPLPEPDSTGSLPAVEYARASLARKIVKMRMSAGLTQAELARRAGIRAETLNRIEKGKTTPGTATVGRIERALQQSDGQDR